MDLTLKPIKTKKKPLKHRTGIQTMNKKGAEMNILTPAHSTLDSTPPANKNPLIQNKKLFISQDGNAMRFLVIPPDKHLAHQIKSHGGQTLVSYSHPCLIIMSSADEDKTKLAPSNYPIYAKTFIDQSIQRGELEYLKKHLLQGDSAMDKQEDILDASTSSSSFSSLSDMDLNRKNEQGETQEEEQEQEETQEEEQEQEEMQEEEWEQEEMQEEEQEQVELKRDSVNNHSSSYQFSTDPPSSYVHFVNESDMRDQFPFIHLEDSPRHLDHPNLKNRKQGTRTRTRYRQILDEYRKPPMALMDCPKAPEPPSDRTTPKYMQIEDYCLLIWFVRSIPYINNTKSVIRWNWARTHGVVSRSLESMVGRWKLLYKIISHHLPIPPGRFRDELVKSELFLWKEDTIFGMDVTQVKKRNAHCLNQQDLGLDFANEITQDEGERNRRAKVTLNSLEGGDSSGRKLLDKCTFLKK